jgi:hypothetical protein
VDQDHHPAVLIEPGVEDHGPQRPRGVALRRRDAGHDGLQDLFDPDPLLGGGQDGVRGVDPDDGLDLLAYLFRLRARQVDLVQDRG